jgi:ribosomal protein S18 acetylase RimI-like enzyme
VTAGRPPLFCDTALAERIERAEAQLIAEAGAAARRRRADTAGFVIPVCGGVASLAEEGSPFNKVAGLGFAGVPGAAALDEIEQAFAVCARLRMAGGIAQLTGAATAPAHRRRGVQTALLSARLADAAAAGCDIAVVTTQPGSKSQQNVQRQGFDPLYTRAVLVKQP